MITTPVTADLVHGAIDLESTGRGLRPHRLPQAVRERDADQQLTLVEAQPSGVRVVVATAARQLVLEVHAARTAYRGMDRPRGAVDVVLDGSVHLTRTLTAGDVLELDPRTGSSVFTAGTVDRIDVGGLPPGEKVVEFWLPHNEQVDLVALSSDASVRAVPSTRPVWLHHGSSISQGSNAASPTATWPAVAARRAGVQLVNLGFGGSAVADPFTARVVRDAPADVISIKLGINVVNLDAMRLRTFVPAVHGFLDTVREGHPTTPLLLISPIHCALHEDTPGPGAFDPTAQGTGSVRFIATGRQGDTAHGRLTLEVIRRALLEVVERRRQDPHLHHLDGQTLYGQDDAEQFPLPDGLHPDTATHALMGERFATTAFAAGGPFETARSHAGRPSGPVA